MTSGHDRIRYSALKVLAACATAGAAASGCASSADGPNARAPVEYRNAMPAPSAASDANIPFYQKQARQNAPGVYDEAMSGRGNVRPFPPAADTTYQGLSSSLPAAPALDPAKLGEPVEVLPGDTLFRVSERYRIALRALIETNELEPPFELEPGQILYLPPPNVHVVEEGETLYSISRRYNVDTRSLSLMNGLPKPWTIHPGDKITLPSLARDSERDSHGEQSVDPAKTAPGSEGWRVPPATNSTPRFDEPSPLRSKPFTAGDGAVPLRSFGVVGSAGAERPFPAISGGDGSFIWPLRGEVLRPYGQGAGGRKNDGVNISAMPGTPILAAAAGQIVYAGDELAGFGNLVLISHADGWVTAYAHADELVVREGQSVAQGQPIGSVGATGSVDRPQLHFELRKGKDAVDPARHMPPLGAT